jgi:hypothetical protein
MVRVALSDLTVAPVNEMLGLVGHCDPSASSDRRLLRSMRHAGRLTADAVDPSRTVRVRGGVHVPSPAHARILLGGVVSSIASMAIVRTDRSELC